MVPSERNRSYVTLSAKLGVLAVIQEKLTMMYSVDSREQQMFMAGHNYIRTRSAEKSIKFPVQSLAYTTLCNIR